MSLLPQFKASRAVAVAIQLIPRTVALLIMVNCKSRYILIYVDEALLLYER